MKWNFSSITIGLLSALVPILPAIATPTNSTPVNSTANDRAQLAQWRSDLQWTFCNESWTEALSLAGALMGSDNISEDERLWLFVLRQDIYNYYHGIAEFEGCEGGIIAGATAQESFAASVDSPSTNPSLNWNRGLSSLGGNPRSRVAATPTNSSSRGTDLASVAASPSTACTPYSSEEVRVANGSTSNQWNYEVWQRSRESFYTRYWDQNGSCDQSRSTSNYSSQEEAYQAFRRTVGLPN